MIHHVIGPREVKRHENKLLGCGACFLVVASPLGALPTILDLLKQYAQVVFDCSARSEAHLFLEISPRDSAR